MIRLLGPEVIKKSCSTELSIKFQLIKTKMLKNKDFSCFQTDVIFIMLIDVKMPTIMPTFVSRINLMLS